MIIRFDQKTKNTKWKMYGFQKYVLHEFIVTVCSMLMEPVVCEFNPGIAPLLSLKTPQKDQSLLQQYHTKKRVCTK